MKEALFSIPNTKARGPDGFTAGFYKDSGDLIGNEVTHVVLNFFTSGRLLGQINTTNITLVPKIKCPKSVSDYRPISCCNVIYKLIYKLLTQRLAEVLPDLISLNQSAFVKGRTITSSILLCQDIVRNYHR